MENAPVSGFLKRSGVQIFRVKALLLAAFLTAGGNESRAQLPAELSFLTKGIWNARARCVGDSCTAIERLSGDGTEYFRFAAEAFACPSLGKLIALRMDRYTLERDPVTDKLQHWKSSCPDYLGFLTTKSDSVWHVVVCGEHWPYVARLLKTSAHLIEIEALSQDGNRETVRYEQADTASHSVERILDKR